MIDLVKKAWHKKILLMKFFLFQQIRTSLLFKLCFCERKFGNLRKNMDIE